VRRNMPLFVKTTICMMVFVAPYGIAISQEPSKYIETGVILSAQDVEQMLQLVQRRRRAVDTIPWAPFWTPSPEEIGQLETQLKRYLGSETAPQGTSLPARLGSYVGLGSYKRQYLGYTYHGKRLVLVNGFCEKYGDYPVDKPTRLTAWLASQL
jgi:hypothetical protein